MYRIQVNDKKSETCQHSLSGGLQLTDLKPDQKIVLAHTLTQVGLGDGVQLSGWNWQSYTDSILL